MTAPAIQSDLRFEGMPPRTDSSPANPRHNVTYAMRGALPLGPVFGRPMEWRQQKAPPGQTGAGL